MDPKAAAKSKRSQSQQGRRNHPTPSAAVAHKKKEAPTQSKQPQHGGVQRSRRHQHNLPSNWDRYDEDEYDDTVVEADEGGPDQVRRDAKEPAAKVKQPLAGDGDALAPKSKGADFKYLVEQARSQARDRVAGEDDLAFTSLSDETVPDFVPGLLSIISAKGESLLSWCSNDNFTVDDDDAGSSFEVPFLSMDVNALASQLSKLSMAQRLFIEEDILPPELHADGLKESNAQKVDHLEAQNSSGSKHCLAEDTLPGAENVQVGDDQSKTVQLKAVEGHDSMQSSGKGPSPLLSQGQDMQQDPINSLESPKWDSNRRSGESGSNAGMNTFEDSVSKFEAAAAETELDRLLDSFGGINNFASSSFASSTFTANNAFDHLVHMDAVSSRQESSSLSKAGAGVALEETVNEILTESHASCSPGISEDLSSSSSTRLKPRDLSTDVYAGSSTSGFSDSKRIVPLEKSLDDLLAETNFFYSSSINVQRDGVLAKDRPQGSSVRVDAPYPKEGHDSRHAASTISLDETIDDLLAETSSHLKNPEHSPHPQGKSQIPHVKPTFSKALDDIDTWLDSI